MEISDNNLHYKILFLGENFIFKNTLINTLCGQIEYKQRAILCCDYRYKIARISGKDYNIKILNIDGFDVNNVTISEYIKCVHCLILISDKIFDIDRLECSLKYVISNKEDINPEDVNSVEKFFNKILNSIINFYDSKKDIILEDENKIVFQYKKKVKKKKSFSCF